MNVHRTLAVAVISAAVLVSGAAPALASQSAATPVPGRFCKAAEAGKKVKTTKYGWVRCTKDGNRARWKQL